MRWNLLVRGPRQATEAFVLTLTPHLQSPIRRAACEQVRGLPAEGGTLILEDVEKMDEQEQQRLLWWLEEYSRTGVQVITIAPAALSAHVQAGTFLNTLYYRLNLICVDVGPSGADA